METRLVASFPSLEYTSCKQAGHPARKALTYPNILTKLLPDVHGCPEQKDIVIQRFLPLCLNVV